MKLNRRNVLVGLGTIVAGGGAALGTGAFSTVQADRTVDLNTADDNDGALLQLEDGGSELVTVNNAGQLELSSDSLNQNALTRADGAIKVSNGGENNVGFYVADDSLSVLDFEVNNRSIVGRAVNLPADGSELTVDLIIDLRDDDTGESDVTDDDITDELTFVADVEQYNDETDT